MAEITEDELTGITTIYWYFKGQLEANPDIALTNDYLDDLAKVVNKHGDLKEDPLNEECDHVDAECEHDDLQEHAHPWRDYAEALPEGITLEYDSGLDAMVSIDEF